MKSTCLTVVAGLGDILVLLINKKLITVLLVRKNHKAYRDYREEINNIGKKCGSKKVQEKKTIAITHYETVKAENRTPVS